MSTRNSNHSANRMGSYLTPIQYVPTTTEAAGVPPGLLQQVAWAIAQIDFEDEQSKGKGPGPKPVCQYSGNDVKVRGEQYLLVVTFPKGARKPSKLCFYITIPAGFGGNDGPRTYELACIPPSELDPDGSGYPYSILVNIPTGNDTAYQDTEGMDYDVYGVATYADGSTQESTHAQFTVAYP